MNKKSKKYFSEAKQILVGGVNSPVRAFTAVGKNPLFIKKAEGAYIFTEDDQRLLDYVLSWGPCILGHAHPNVIQSIEKTIKNGLSFGAPSVLETQLAKLIQEFMPHIEKIRFVNSGTEAAMSALRLARGYTKKKFIVKFNGCYHGHADPFLVAAGSGNLTLSKPDSEGVLESTSQYTLVCDYNNSEQLTHLFNENGRDIAGIILEPITGNMGVIPPTETFLSTLNKLCKTYDSLLIFDEVMSGFRCHKNGAQALLNTTPDITILGKVIGGGLPCGAYGGKAEIMEKIAPEGPIYQAGTLSGNPIVMASGIATLTELKNTKAFETAEQSCTFLCEELRKQLNKDHYCIQNQGTMFSLFFKKGPIQNLTDVQNCNLKQFPKFFHALLENNIYWPPSAYEACFISCQHKAQEIQHTVKTVKKSLSTIQN
ncbi:MAG: glutamate-1-semialdehyde 2,1-aminomutase [bacterium]